VCFESETAETRLLCGFEGFSFVSDYLLPN
jgi:hypothetical protein